MAKFCGNIGYVITEEIRPGVYKENVIEKKYYGDIVRNARNYQIGEGLNDDVNIANEISIVADSFANENFYLMRYVCYMGTKWKINNVDIQYPRLILSIGGVYNGES